MYCSICDGETQLTRHLPLYIRGSEGIEICHNCEMELVEYLRNIVRACSRSRIRIAKDLKRIEETKTKVKDKLRKIEEKIGNPVCPMGIRFIPDHTESTCDPIKCDWDTIMRNCTEACMVDYNGGDNG